MTPDFTSSTAQAVWQIERQTFDGSTIKTEFANSGKWNCIWDNRTAYFGPSGGVPFPTPSFSGTFTPQGLNIAGRMTEITVNDATWTALPAVSLPNRNALCIQNQSNVAIKLQYDPSVLPYSGIIVLEGGERTYDIKPNITVYGRSFSGDAIVVAEELS
jgi:hypothetical protein